MRFSKAVVKHRVLILILTVALLVDQVASFDWWPCLVDQLAFCLVVYCRYFHIRIHAYMHAYTYTRIRIYTYTYTYMPPIKADND